MPLLESRISFESRIADPVEVVYYLKAQPEAVLQTYQNHIASLASSTTNYRIRANLENNIFRVQERLAPPTSTTLDQSSDLEKVIDFHYGGLV